MGDEKIIPSSSICADLDLPLRRLKGAAHAIECMTFGQHEIEIGDLWFIESGIWEAIKAIKGYVAEIDERVASKSE